MPVNHFENFSKHMLTRHFNSNSFEYIVPKFETFQLELERKSVPALIRFEKSFKQDKDTFYIKVTLSKTKSKYHAFIPCLIDRSL